MKSSVIIVFSSIILFASCKKDTDSFEHSLNPDKSGSTAKRAAPDDLSDKVKVSANGFLILPDSSSMTGYLDFLDSNSTEDIVKFHEKIGFASQAGVEGQASNYFAPSVHNSEYLFNQSGIVQFGNVIYRSVNDDGYFLAMPATSLNETSYSKLVAKTFDSDVMCKLKVGGDYGANLNEYVLDHIGDEDTTTPPTPPETCGKRVRWYSAGGVTICDESWYVLGIRVFHRVTIFDDRP